MTFKEGNEAGREAFVSNIANRLGRTKPLTEQPAHPLRGIPDHYKKIELTQEEKIRLFSENWTALSGKVHIVKENEAGTAVFAYLKQVIEELGVSKVARWEYEPLNSLGLDQPLETMGVEVVPWRGDLDGESEKLGALEIAEHGEAAHFEASKQRIPPEYGASEPSHASNWSKRSSLLKSAEQCEMGIVWPDYAIANTSTLMLLAKGGKGRSVSLLPGILFAVFRADQLVTRMGEALAAVKEAYPETDELPSSINMITGPSRSADIENDLTIGIHGPGKVYSVIIVP